MNLHKVPKLVTILIITVITILFWIVIDIYRTLTIAPAPAVPAEVVAPLDPSLDEGLLNSLEERVYIPDDQITDTILVVTPIPEIATPQPSEEPTSEPTQQESTSPTPQASP